MYHQIDELKRPYQKYYDLAENKEHANADVSVPYTGWVPSEYAKNIVPGCYWWLDQVEYSQLKQKRQQDERCNVDSRQWARGFRMV